MQLYSAELFFIQSKHSKLPDFRKPDKLTNFLPLYTLYMHIMNIMKLRLKPEDWYLSTD